jgi:hypothetical protein
LWKKCYSLTELVSPSQFKSYDELKKKLDDVLSLPSSGSSKPAEKLSSKAKEPEVSDEEEDDEVGFSSSFDDIDDIARLLAEDDPI